HPWIQIDDPFTGQPLLVPPSGAVAGIYALTDARRGVHKAPAGLDTGKVVVATGLELKVTKAEYDILYQDEVNAILSLRDGFHVWGSRTISADPEWQQVSIRRLFNFLEKSIENGTQWVTFEPNDPTLWKSIERNVAAFLRIQWLEGKLVGASEKEAFFVHCNAETNPPEVVNAGQVVTVIGAAPSRPAEFVIFRIRQKVGQSAGGRRRKDAAWLNPSRPPSTLRSCRPASSRSKASAPPPPASSATPSKGRSASRRRSTTSASSCAASAASTAT